MGNNLNYFENHTNCFSKQENPILLNENLYNRITQNIFVEDFSKVPKYDVPIYKDLNVLARRSKNDPYVKNIVEKIECTEISLMLQQFQQQ